MVITLEVLPKENYVSENLLLLCCKINQDLLKKKVYKLKKELKHM